MANVIPEIESAPCECPSGWCPSFWGDDRGNCVNRLPQGATIKPCPVCHPNGNGATWHDNVTGQCLRCEAIEKGILIP